MNASTLDNELFVELSTNTNTRQTFKVTDCYRHCQTTAVRRRHNCGSSPASGSKQMIVGMHYQGCHGRQTSARTHTHNTHTNTMHSVKILQVATTTLWSSPASSITHQRQVVRH